jgi:hypothetical protein
MENFDATNGIDTHTQTAKADTLTITNTNQMQGTDFFDGGRGFDTIVIGTTGAGTIIGIGIDPSAAAGFTTTTPIQNWREISISSSSATKTFITRRASCIL